MDKGQAKRAVNTKQSILNLVWPLWVVLRLGLIYYSCLGIRLRQHAWRIGAGRESEKVRHCLGEWMWTEEWTAGIALVAEKEQNNKKIWHKRWNFFRDN